MHPRLLCCLLIASCAAAGPFDPVTRQAHRETVTRSRHAYSLRVGGTADMENTLSRDHCNISIAFPNNVSLTLANIGKTLVRNPKLIVNDRGNWGDVDSLIAEWTRGATNDQERALLLWQHMRENRYHSSPLYADQEFHDPVRLFGIYGLALCDDDGYAGAGLFNRAGLNQPKYASNSMVRSLNGHVQCEAALDNGLQFLDVDQDCFYLDRENERPVSGDALEDDHDLVRREMNYGPTVNEKSWRASESVASLFGADDKLYEYSLIGHEMKYDLRPGESVTFRWDNLGKFAAQNASWANKPNFFGNSRFTYRPPLTRELWPLAAATSADLQAVEHDGAPVLVAQSAQALLVVPVKLPYTICGATVTARYDAAAGDTVGLDVSLDGKEWREIATGQEGTLTAALDQALDVHNNPPKRQYFIRLRLAAAQPETLRLRDLTLETDVMAAPMALPRLVLGDNRAVYTDDTEGPHEVTITHEWQESSALTALPPLAAPAYPAPDATVRDAILTYKWPAVPGAKAYHLQVSTYSDMKIIYRPSLDVIIPTNQWVVPFTGIYSPDRDYYWRVRARDGNGLWSAWSGTWRFRWDGPRVPVNVRVEQGVLKWDANPRGPRPAKYEVYGSDEKGFLCSKTEYHSYGRGTVPGNFLSESAATELRVLDSAATAPNLNRCFYRVMAVDAHGTPSGSSAYAELPHPFIYSAPPTEAKAGQAYQYPVRVVRSLGDCQHKGDPVKQTFHDIEQITYKLTGPAWLKIDGDGLISGTPPGGDGGEVAVKVEAATQFGESATQEFKLRVAP